MTAPADPPDVSKRGTGEKDGSPAADGKADNQQGMWSAFDGHDDKDSFDESLAEREASKVFALWDLPVDAQPPSPTDIVPPSSPGAWDAMGSTDRSLAPPPPYGTSETATPAETGAARAPADATAPHAASAPATEPDAPTERVAALDIDLPPRRGEPTLRVRASERRARPDSTRITSAERTRPWALYAVSTLGLGAAIGVAAFWVQSGSNEEQIVAVALSPEERASAPEQRLAAPEEGVRAQRREAPATPPTELDLPPPPPDVAVAPAAAPGPAPARLRRVKVRLVPAAGTLLLDGTAVTNPFDGRLPEGSVHTFDATAEGFRSTTYRIEVSRDRDLTLRLEPLPHSPPAARAHVVRRTPRARSAHASPPARETPTTRPRGAGFVTESPY